jgi:hypothetical protein
VEVDVLQQAGKPAAVISRKLTTRLTGDGNCRPRRPTYHVQ